MRKPAYQPVAPQLDAQPGIFFPLEEEIGQVVYGYHVGLNHQQGDAVQRKVHQVGRESAQKHGKQHVVQMAFIFAGVDGGAEVLGQTRQVAHVFRPAHQGVAVGGIDRAQSLHQAADVCSDAEIADSPGIDDDVQGRHSQARTGSSFQE
jgi:hypothetical protein